MFRFGSPKYLKMGATYLYVFLISVGEVRHVPVVDLLAHEARTHALLCVWSRCLLPNFPLVGFLLVLLLDLGFIGLVDSIIFILSLHFLLSNLIRYQVVLLLFHGSCTSIRHLVCLSHLWTGTATVLVLLVTLREIISSHFLVSSLVHAALFLDHSQLLHSLCVGCICDEGGSDQIDEHGLPV